ncbi:hypothetical protein Tco_1006238 [Tanacetum coccineum]|uniref:Integrase, catalytic region, zinc finger, CCHC-type, peptidase aspartic, catalytic n=1 Tax=Tanacetum coccineum TaxID=301880 RepID=A0ABQ5FH79_9ASTR
MTTLAEHMIVAGANNHPPMLEKSIYTSWASHMLLYIKGKEHGRMMLNSVLNGPLAYPTIYVDGVTRLKTYEVLSDKEKLQDDCDLRATNIVLQGLPPYIYVLVNHNQVAKQIWDRVKLLLQGIELSYQERECKLYNEFDKFASIKGETLHDSYMRKFVTDVKLEKSMYTTNYDQLYAYLSQYEGHTNEVRLMRERYPDPFALVATHHHISSYPNNNSQYNTSQYQQQLSLPSLQTYNSSTRSQFFQAPHHPQQYQAPISHLPSSVPQHAYQAPSMS